MLETIVATITGITLGLQVRDRQRRVAALEQAAQVEPPP
jgi:hypothetical protein